MATPKQRPKDDIDQFFALLKERPADRDTDAPARTSLRQRLSEADEYEAELQRSRT